MNFTVSPGHPPPPTQWCAPLNPLLTIGCLWDSPPFQWSLLLDPLSCLCHSTHDVLVWLNLFTLASCQVICFVSTPMPKVCNQLLIQSLQIMHSYLRICVQQVDTFPTNHFLHNWHHRASTPLSGCLPSLKTATRSAIWMLLPVLECILVFLRAYPYSMVSWSNLGLTHVTYLSILCSHLVQLQKLPLFLIWSTSHCVRCVMSRPLPWWVLHGQGYTLH